jgi:hypothetical protein
MTDLYTNVNRTATTQQAKRFLKEYRTWRLGASRFHKQISPSNPQVSDTASANFECALRIKTIEALRTIDAQSTMHADLLYFRYINNWSVTKVSTKIAEKYELTYIAERTYTNHLNKALWEFAVVCPRNLFVYK